MNAFVLRKITVNGAYQPLSSTKLIATVTISCPPANTGTVYFKGDNGLDVPWVPGEWHEFKNVDLNAIQVKGNTNDTVTVVGGTW
jgi:hypothetical protein